MKQFLLILVTCLFFSCDNGKVIELPEIPQSDIHEILDVSAAYLFYDETTENGFELNRKNLISTTNWLINVDKRLSLKQVIPNILFLQEKKNNASHKNKNAKNYYTCHDLKENSLGFIDFTHTVYHINNIQKTEEAQFKIICHSENNIQIESTENASKSIETTLANFNNKLMEVANNYETPIKLILNFHESLNFQNYISLKALLINSDSNVLIARDEFIFN